MKAVLSKIWHVLKQTWCWTLIGVLLVVGLLWWQGPQLAFANYKPFESIMGRVVGSMILLFLWGALLLIGSWVRSKREQTEEQKELARQQARLKERVADDLGVFNERLNDAIGTIRRTSLYGKRKDKVRYELPWYLMMGAEGSGKTSLLEHSGIDFPLNNNRTRISRDIGSTRYCNWYFSNNCVLLDAAGRYTNFVEPEIDRPVWEGFLQTLQQKRRRRPLNGILFTLELDRLLGSAESELEEYARLVRERMQELQQQLRSEIPVYLILTKSDKLGGFKAFFDKLSSEERDQVVGVTFKEEVDGTRADVIRDEFEELLRRINSQVLTRVHEERDLHNRGDILQFPRQLATLLDPLMLFAELAFGKTRYHQHTALRGFYLTSAPDDQLMMDHVTASIGQQLGMDSHIQPVSGSERGLFIRRLLEEVIFPESELATLDERYERRIHWSNRFAYTAAIAVVVMAGAGWSIAFINNSSQQQSLKVFYNKFHDKYLRLSPLSNASSTLPALDTLYQATQIYPNTQTQPLIRYLDLSQQQKLQPLVVSSYHNQLQKLLLPRVASELEEQIAANLNNRDFLYKSLRAYLMLGDAKHLDPDYLKQWLALDWSYRYSGESEVQSNLQMHLSHLLDAGFSPLTLNQTLINKARHVLRESPTAEVVYQMIKQDPTANQLPAFDFASQFNAQFSVFNGGNYKIPGLYTRAGYQQIFLRKGLGLVKGIVKDNWVEGTSTELSDLELRRIYAEVEQMYFRDYLENWQNALNRLQLVKLNSINDADNLVTGMTIGGQPILAVLRAIRDNTIFLDEKLLTDKAGKAGKGLVKGPNAQMMKLAASGMSSALAQIKQDGAREAVTERFKNLNQLMPDGKQQTVVLQDAYVALNNLQQQLASIEHASDPSYAAYQLAKDRMGGKPGAISGLQIAADKLPAPLNNWLKDLAGQSWHLVLVETQQHLQARYDDAVMSTYTGSIAKRYPFVNGKQEVSLGDFDLFFKPQGVFDQFVKNELKPFIRNENGYYRVRTMNDQGLPLSNRFLDQIRNLHQIQQGFFAENPASAQVSFKLEPLELAPNALKSEFHYGNGALIYQHGPIQSQSFQWPLQSERTYASLRLQNLSGIELTIEQAAGPWAIFRLLDQVSLSRYSGQNVLKLDVNQEGLDAEYLLSSKFSPNPLWRNLLTDFDLPAVL